MSGTFQCPKCQVRVYLPDWDGEAAPWCATDENHGNESFEMRQVD
jgi:hypothetical protein